MRVGIDYVRCNGCSCSCASYTLTVIHRNNTDEDQQRFGIGRCRQRAATVSVPTPTDFFIMIVRPFCLDKATEFSTVSILVECQNASRIYGSVEFLVVWLNCMCPLNFSPFTVVDNHVQHQSLN